MHAREIFSSDILMGKLKITVHFNERITKQTAEIILFVPVCPVTRSSALLSTVCRSARSWLTSIQSRSTRWWWSMEVVPQLWSPASALSSTCPPVCSTACPHCWPGAFSSNTDCNTDKQQFYIFSVMMNTWCISCPNLHVQVQLMQLISWLI